jgi:transcriptional regulator with XRE-family HTH domain
MEITLPGTGAAPKGITANRARKAGVKAAGFRQIVTSVKQFRILRGLTLRELSRKLNLSIGQCSRIERGLSEPSILLALRIAEVLDGSVRELWPSQTVKHVLQGDAVALAETTLAGGKE